MLRARRAIPSDTAIILMQSLPYHCLRYIN
jgi:hypothetical protein